MNLEKEVELIFSKVGLSTRKQTQKEIVELAKKFAESINQQPLQQKTTETIYRHCPNCNHPNTKEESCNKYVCRYCESESDTEY